MPMPLLRFLKDDNGSLVPGRLLIVVAILVLFAGLLMYLLAPGTQPKDDQARNAAQQSAAEVAERISAIHDGLGHPYVLRTVSARLAGDVRDEAVKEALATRGIDEVMAVAVFTPPLEEIEIGEYPDPDYAVLQMLIEARRNGQARSQVHYPGTADENLAVARSILANDEEVAGLLFVRLPMSVLDGALIDPGDDVGLRLTQDSRDILVRSSLNRAGEVASGQVDVPGSTLAVEWSQGRQIGPWNRTNGLRLLVAGVLLLAAGAVLLWLVSRPARRTAPAKAEPEERILGVATATTAARDFEPEPEPEEADSPRPDLPDWLLDDAGDDAAEVFRVISESDEESSVDKAEVAEDAGEFDFLGDDMPDLDEIMEQIEPRSGSTVAPEEPAIADEPGEGLSIADPDVPTEQTEAPNVAIPEAQAPGIFRGETIRGSMDSSLDAAKAHRIGQGIGTMAIGRGLGRICVGRDGRFSGPVLLSALIRGLLETGMQVMELGPTPSPLVWFMALESADGCGVSVTAPQDNPEYNGFRVMLGGEFLDADGVSELERIIDADEFVDGDGSHEQADALERYRGRLAADIQLERPLKVVVDCGNGIVGSVVIPLLEAIGADVIPLYCDVDGSFPNHPPDPSKSENLEDLRLCLRNFQAEVGVAFDGDGGRLAVLSSEGYVVAVDRLLMLLASVMLPATPGAGIVCDVRGPAQLAKLVEEAGGRLIATATGPAAVQRAMRQEDAVLAAEMSGHLFVADRWYAFDDALYAAARVLELLAADSRDLDAIVAELPDYWSSPEERVEMPVHQARELLERLGSEADFGPAKVTRLDGLRVDYSDCWGLARVCPESGALVLSFGANDGRALARIRGEFKVQLHNLDPDLLLPY